jgi:hypothetical protein
MIIICWVTWVSVFLGMWSFSLPRIFQRSLDMVRETIRFGMLENDQHATEQLRTEPEHVQTLRRLHATLAVCMEPESGLVDHLLSIGVFSHRELEYVHSDETVHQKNCRILEFMYEKNEEQYARFLDALHSTKQSHVVKFINGNGYISPDYPDDRPLTEQEISMITNNLNDLVRTLEPYPVTDHLFAMDCLTRRSITLIKSKQTREEVTRQLLDILTRRSKRDLKMFYAILKEHKQNLAASILEPILSIIGFIPASRRHEIKYESKCFINDLPPELLERILIKVFSMQLSRTPHLVKRLNTVSLTVQLLGYVSSSWQALMSNEKFKTRIAHQINAKK